MSSALHDIAAHAPFAIAFVGGGLCAIAAAIAISSWRDRRASDRETREWDRRHTAPRSAP